MRVVVIDRRFCRALRGRYTLDLEIDYAAVSNSLPLTQKVREHFKQNKSGFNYATFRGLAKGDILSILSSVKRQEAIVNVNRWGHIASYKLLKFQA